MSRDMKPRRAPAKKSHGGTLVGLFVGLVLGIVGAAAVVWYINKMPTPFAAGAAAGSAKPENGKTAGQGPACRASAAAGQARRPGTGKAVPVLRHTARQGRGLSTRRQAGAEEAKADAKIDGKTDGKDKEPAIKEPIFLQAGSFQTAGDADKPEGEACVNGYGSRDPAGHGAGQGLVPCPPGTVRET